ncbi:Molybdopterin molybdenumtransferase [hydrothermal vent metagenome]|uniref:molybdopterin molybdotransferase n=1 Tax=hydrothermal vent metagenome TaxID=652676 RepID=A0A3B0ZML5_9ZZZZ
MDGYALRHDDLATQGSTTLPISQRITAGDIPLELAASSTARIFTGATIPAGADTVIPQEQSHADNGRVTFAAPASIGQHIRRAGEDIEQGSSFLSAGYRIQPQAMGLIGANGIATIPVFRRLKVALLSTGSELLMPGSALQNGKRYNANHFTLTGLLQALGCEVIDRGTIPDKLSATISALEAAASDADLIISSGGVSVGEEDYVKAAIEQLGKLEIWKLNIKPGKPLAFGEANNTPFFGLPGNPVSLFVTFCLFARPYILRMQGIENVQPQTIKVQAQFNHIKKSSRQEYIRSRLLTSEYGSEVKTFGKQGSGILSSTVWANSLTIIPPGSSITPGDQVEVIPFNELIT